MRTRRNLAGLVLFVTAFGCVDTSSLSGHPGGVVGPTPSDDAANGGEDLSGAVVDLATPSTPDIASAGDAVMGADMILPSDLSGSGADLVSLPDLTPAADLLSLPDLRMPTDLAMPPRVLVLHADTMSNALDIKQMLAGTAAFAGIDTFDGTAATPTLAQLQKYDAILISASSGWLDRDAIGNVLADYYDAGGRVVLTIYAFGYLDTFAMNPKLDLVGGRFGDVANGYMLINPANTDPNINGDSLGVINEANSPLVAGVKTLSTSYGVRLSVATPINGGIVVASYKNNGRPLLVRGVVKGRNRVDVNLVAYQNGVMGIQFWSGDGATLFKNALLFK